VAPFKRFIAKTVFIDGDYNQRIALAMDVLLIVGTEIRNWPFLSKHTTTNTFQADN
jgi:hypothetical protein